MFQRQGRQRPGRRSTAKVADSSELINVLLEEYYDRRAEISLRVDLCQRNLNLFLILFTATAGYVATLISTRGYNEAAKSEETIALSILALVGITFVIRHLDHDANIVDSAKYIERVIRPEIERETGRDALRWETYLSEARAQRARRYLGATTLGGELAILIAILTVIEAVCWYIFLTQPEVAGSLNLPYRVFTVFSTLLLLWLIFAFIRFGYSYRSIPILRP